ncbi:MAG: acyl-CoA dehydrogenase [Acidimicrobiia bacterium]
MSIAISEDHKALAETAADFLTNRGAIRAARTLLETPDEPITELWGEMVAMGWPGLHIPEEYGGSGYSLEELVVVIEQTGREVTPGPLVPTTIASAVIDAVADEATKARLLPGLVDGSLLGGIGLGGSVSANGDKVSGDAGTVLGGGLANIIVVPTGADLAIVEVGAGTSVENPPNLDPTRRSARVSFDGAEATVVAGGAQALVDLARVILAAEATGLAAASTDQGAQYAKERLQFGRVIGTYQAVKHHCANMAVATELATSAVWDAAKAAATGGDVFTFTAATAASLAADAAYLCANLNTQVHGGIAITWEHDAHLNMRRSIVLGSIIRPDDAAADLVDLTRKGVSRGKEVELPEEAEPIRAEVQAFIAEHQALPEAEQKANLIDSGYAFAHWPAPYGRNAGPIEQLVIEQEFAKAGIQRPNLGITGWNILTLVQYATQDQLDRWVMPALNQEVIWCQLFSEPDAGSDAAGVKTKATRVDGGWLVNGQKVWTSGAHLSSFGLATVRTNPDVPKHDGITMMVIDMHAEGVEVRPLRQTSGDSGFNEVFFTDVFVPDDDVVGPVDGGWTVARATLGNESVSIGGGQGGMSVPPSMLVETFDAHPERLDGGAARLGRYIAKNQAIGLLNLRAVNRAVAGAGPGPEGAMTKLILSELGHESAAFIAEMNGPDTAFTDGLGAIGHGLFMMHRGMSIAGGTSEIKRNQIGERILGLPRDPLIK